MSSAALLVTIPKAHGIMPLRRPHLQPHNLWWGPLKWERGFAAGSSGRPCGRRNPGAGAWRTEAAGVEGVEGVKGPQATCRCRQRLGKAGRGFLRIRCLTLLGRGAHCRAGTTSTTRRWGNSAFILIGSLKRERSRNRWKPSSPDTDSYLGPTAASCLMGTPTPLSRRPARPPSALSPCCPGAGVVRKGKKPEGQRGKEIGKISSILR